MNTIVVQTRTELVHRYVKAPEEVAFLRDWHRHELHITVELEVHHDDRELEFLMIKRQLNEYLRASIDLRYVQKSCEQIAQQIAKLFARDYGERKMKISVFEDGENGGVYYHNCEM